MDALRRSVQAEGGGRTASRATGKKGRKKIEGQKEMLLPIAGKKAAREDTHAKPHRAAARHRKAGYGVPEPAAVPPHSGLSLTADDWVGWGAAALLATGLALFSGCLGAAAQDRGMFAGKTGRVQLRHAPE